MKKLLSLVLLTSGIVSYTSVKAQDATEDKSKRPSPPAIVTQKINSGATITIDYSQPSLKGRTIGKDIEPMDGQIWRTGANEATTFETDKDIEVEGQNLPAGKYSLFTLWDKEQATVIFNKTAKQWGAYKYDAAEDALTVKGDVDKVDASTEKMNFNISPDGMVALNWGNYKLEFKVK